MGKNFVSLDPAKCAALASLILMRMGNVAHKKSVGQTYESYLQGLVLRQGTQTSAGLCLQEECVLALAYGLGA